MVRKFIFIIILISMCFYVAGCAPTSLSDEVLIENTINNYLNALNDKDWENARSLCVEGSWQYNQISVIESSDHTYYYENLGLISNILITDLDIYLDATVGVSIKKTDYFEQDTTITTESWNFNLQKTSDTWLIDIIYSNL